MIRTQYLDHTCERNTHRCIVEEEESGRGIVKRIKGMFWVLLCGGEKEKKRRDEEVESNNKGRGFESPHGGRREGLVESNSQGTHRVFILTLSIYKCLELLQGDIACIDLGLSPVS